MIEHITPELLYDLYCKNNFTIKKVSEQIGLPYKKTQYLLNKNGLESNVRIKDFLADYKTLDYVNLGIKYNITRKRIKKLAEKYKISKPENYPLQTVTKDDIKRLYCKKRMTVGEIAKKLNIRADDLMIALQEDYNIYRRVDIDEFLDCQ
jgi:hypothetical protein